VSQSRRDQDLYGGLIRRHILHHALKGAIFGLWFIKGLARHGYKFGPGTLYTLLHGLDGRDTSDQQTDAQKELPPCVSSHGVGVQGAASRREKLARFFDELLDDE
jgi:PadR family transcriptional regulator, regulatory protein PadR